jgi:hypothetical protein
MHFKAHLSIVCPGTSDSRILGEMLQGGMVGLGQVLVYSKLASRSVGCGILALRQRTSLVSEYYVSCGRIGKFHNDGHGGTVFGRNGEGGVNKMAGIGHKHVWDFT